MSLVHTLFKKTFIAASVLAVAATGTALLVAATSYIQETTFDITELATASRVELVGNSIVISGSIDAITPKVVEHIFNNNINSTPITTIQIASPGGDGVAGIELATFIKSYHLNTFAPSECHSACTIVFTAGKLKTVTANTRMGFHSPGWEFDADMYTADQVRDYVAAVNAYAGIMVKHYIDNGLSTDFVKTVMATRFEKMQYYKATFLIDNKIANNYE